MLLFDDELGLMPGNDRLPLIFLRERRRQLVLALKESRGRITRAQIDEIAAIQQAIRAVEIVIAEIVSIASIGNRSNATLEMRAFARISDASLPC
jgi:hypothetical protein